MTKPKRLTPEPVTETVAVPEPPPPDRTSGVPVACLDAVMEGSVWSPPVRSVALAWADDEFGTRALAGLDHKDAHVVYLLTRDRPGPDGQVCDDRGHTDLACLLRRAAEAGYAVTVRTDLPPAP